MSKVICIDLELNQPTNKIIQLGYIIADCANGQIFVTRSLIIDPNEPLGLIMNMNPPVHISDYTGITEERIKKEGMTLQSAYKTMCDDIKLYNPTTTPVQWGDGSGDNKGDHDCLRRELGLSWDEFVFRPRAWDVKSIFQIYRAFNRQGVIAGVEKTLKILGMEFEGRPHDAKDDAVNTFRIFRVLGEKMIIADKIKKLVK